MEVNVEILECQQRLNLCLTNTEISSDKQQAPLTLRHVLSFIHKNFGKLNNAISMSDILPILHHSIRLELQKGESLHLGVFVWALLNLKEHNYDDTVERCLQILYQVLKTLSADDDHRMQIGDEIYIKLMEILLAERSTRNNANILACLQLYVKKFNPEFVTHIWESIKDNLNSNEITNNAGLLQILIFFFDEFSEQIKGFKQSTEFFKLVQFLLESENRDHRKSALFLLKKAHLFMEDQLKLHIDSSKCENVERHVNFWTICITNFENLEENQSHLILPSLEQLKNLHISELTEQIFLDILYRHILRHNNILVRRWIVEYLLETITYYSLTNRTQKQFMQALNEMALYNSEEYMLPEQLSASRFLKCNKSNFLDVFCQIEWKAIPMHYWLTQLVRNWNAVEDGTISHESLLCLASKIRTMQNVISRQANIVLFKDLFSETIKNMELKKYVQLVKTLYNISDPYYDAEVLFMKIEHCSDHKLDGDCIFTPRFFKILTNHISLDNKIFMNISFAIKAKQEKNGWTIGSLRYLQAFDYFENDLTLTITLETPLKELHEHFCRKFGKNEEERNLIIQKVTDSYAKLWSFKHTGICMEELLDFGSFETLLSVTNCLKTHTSFVGRNKLELLVKRLQDDLKDFKKCSPICKNIMEHCQRLSSIEDKVYCGLMMLELDMENVYLLELVTQYINGNHIPKDFLIKGALMTNTKVGDPRIEEAYQCKILVHQAKNFLLREKYKKLIAGISDDKKKEDILKYLIEQICVINGRKPRFYANSKEHRSILHILGVIIELLADMKIKSNIVLPLLNCLMEHNNQQNITILYEIALSTSIHWVELIPIVVEQLASSCTQSQELSLVVVLYRSFRKAKEYSNYDEFQKLVDILWPLTMGAHFQTRLYAKFGLMTLLDGFEEFRTKHWLIPIPEIFPKLSSVMSDIYPKLSCAIRRTMSQEEIAKMNGNIRFMVINKEECFHLVMDFTNAPYDEYNFLRCSRFRKEATTCQQHKNEIKINDNSLNNSIVQRKLNPVVDFMPRSDLISYPDCQENMLYVVASLIDKIPNLGGIARTCEVFGIKNLVINSKKHIEDPNFKNLSMTAENNLNIVEVKTGDLASFLLEKKTEGFKIVGAEQTATSCSFVNFKFPNRSVLLLGHEKEGISPNLLPFLDYAVEIPQFGLIRSLNVHVTGAIFMWEYCKQHIARLESS